MNEIKCPFCGNPHTTLTPGRVIMPHTTVGGDWCAGTGYDMRLEMGELLSALNEVSAEITRVNKAAGHTVFNPTATSMLRGQIEKVRANLPRHVGEDQGHEEGLDMLRDYVRDKDGT